MLKPKYMVGIITLVLVFLCLCRADAMQQQRFATLQNAYQLMEEKKYNEAMTMFQDYLSIDLDLYWKLVDRENSYEYSRQGVNEAIERCREKMGRDKNRKN